MEKRVLIVSECHINEKQFTVANAIHFKVFKIV